MTDRDRERLASWCDEIFVVQVAIVLTLIKVLIPLSLITAVLYVVDLVWLH